jgi:2-succinyl-5-enolpyruvyl-6-hydroxy-3-cyclohexene-1-carboxylate synthase
MIDTSNRNTALAGALVAELRRSGVERAVASPGSRSSPITLALDRELELSMVLDERAAGFMALGMSLAGGGPVAISCTSGSAAANLHPAIVEADQAGVPLIVLTSDRPPELRQIGAGQTIDQIKLYGDAVRWFCEVGTHDADDAGLLHYRYCGCRAVTEANSGRGPVHLNLAWRDPLGPEPRPDDLTAVDPLAIEGRPDGAPLTMQLGAEAAPEPVTVAAEAVAAAARPLIVAGRQPDPEVAAAIGELAAAAGLPLLAEPTSQLRHGSDRSPTVISAYDLILRDPPAELDPDLVLRFGDMPTSKALRGRLAAAGGPEQIVVDPPGRWNEPSRRAGALLRADAGALARALTARLEAAADPGWLSGWQRAERLTREAVAQVLAASGELISEPSLFADLDRALGEGEQLLLASSMPVRDAEAFLVGSGRRLRCFSNRGANGIDGLVSTAVGLAIAGRAPTWAVLGDLALAHDVGGLANLAAAPEPLRLVVVDNGGGRIFELLPQSRQVERERFERLFITPSSLDFEQVAALFGLDYRLVSRPSDLILAPGAGHTLLHAVVEPSGGVELRRRIASAVAASLSD